MNKFANHNALIIKKKRRRKICEYCKLEYDAAWLPANTTKQSVCELHNQVCVQPPHAQHENSSINRGKEGGMNQIALSTLQHLLGHHWLAPIIIVQESVNPQR